LRTQSVESVQHVVIGAGVHEHSMPCRDQLTDRADRVSVDPVAGNEGDA